MSTNTVTEVNAGKQNKICEGKVKPQTFHFLWRHLAMHFLRDAKVAVPMVQSPIPALDSALKTC